MLSPQTKELLKSIIDADKDLTPDEKKVLVSRISLDIPRRLVPLALAARICGCCTKTIVSVARRTGMTILHPTPRKTFLVYDELAEMLGNDWQQK